MNNDKNIVVEDVVKYKKKKKKSRKRTSVPPSQEGASRSSPSSSQKRKRPSASSLSSSCGEVTASTADADYQKVKSLNNGGVEYEGRYLAEYEMMALIEKVSDPSSSRRKIFRRDEGSDEYIHIGFLVNGKKVHMIGSTDKVEANTGVSPPATNNNIQQEQPIIQQPEFPYPVDESDHCESPPIAYEYIVPILNFIAKKLSIDASQLKIYDPYYCDGGVKTRLKSLGYNKVYNKKKDCYKVWRKNKEPEFDIFLTNPPYSEDHVEKLMNYCMSENKLAGRPWFLLMPDWVHKKDYYKQALGQRRPLYIVPRKRLEYISPPCFRGKIANKVTTTAPFNSFWYIWAGNQQYTDELADYFRRIEGSSGCDVARSRNGLRDLRRKVKNR